MCLCSSKFIFVFIVLDRSVLRQTFCISISYNFLIFQNYTQKQTSWDISADHFTMFITFKWRYQWDALVKISFTIIITLIYSMWHDGTVQYVSWSCEPYWFPLSFLGGIGSIIMCVRIHLLFFLWLNCEENKRKCTLSNNSQTSL